MFIFMFLCTYLSVQIFQLMFVCVVADERSIANKFKFKLFFPFLTCNICCLNTYSYNFLPVKLATLNFYVVNF